MGGQSVSPSILRAGGGCPGSVSTRATPAAAKMTVSQNNPPRPSRLASGTDKTMDSRKAPPIPMPMTAMVTARRSGRVTSAANAMATPAIAPQPCSARPAISRCIDSARAATMPPKANSPRPSNRTGRRP